MNQTRPRHRLIQILGVLGCLISIYTLLQPYVLKNDPVCEATSWFSCGATEVILQMPWLQPFNAVLGFLGFLYFSWCGFKLPKLDDEAIGFRKLLLFLANAGLAYAIFLRFLELFVSFRLCPWCFALFLCMVGIALACWKEWANFQDRRDKSFLKNQFYIDMVKLTILLIVVSFLTVCSAAPILPKINRVTRRNLQEGGFISNIQNGMNRAERQRQPYLVFVYSDTCPHCLEMAKLFNRPEIASWLRDYPKVAVNVADAGIFGKQYDLSTVPSLFIFSSEHDLITVLSGAMGVESFMQEFQKAVPESIDDLP